MESKSCSSIVCSNIGSYTWSLVGFSTVSDKVILLCSLSYSVAYFDVSFICLHKVGDLIESPEFIVCEKQWQLRIFPGGSLPQHAGHVSYYLASKTTSAIRASYKLIILSQLPGEVDEGTFIIALLVQYN